MELEWLFTPMPRSTERSRVSLFVSPSSFASSCTRIFFVAKSCLHLFWVFVVAGQPVTACPALGMCMEAPWVVPVGVQFHSLARSARYPRSRSVASTARSPRTARPKALRRTANSKHGSVESAHSQAPRPGNARPTANWPPSTRAIRTNSSAPRRVRQPTQVRCGSVTKPLPARGSPRARPAPRPRLRSAQGRRRSRRRHRHRW